MINGLQFFDLVARHARIWLHVAVRACFTAKDMPSRTSAKDSYSIQTMSGTSAKDSYSVQTMSGSLNETHMPASRNETADTGFMHREKTI